MTVPETRSRQPKSLDAGIFQPEISSFRLHLAAEGKAGKTVRTYTEAVQWFAAAHLIQQRGRTCWEEVGKQDVQEWVAWLGGGDRADREGGHDQHEVPQNRGVEAGLALVQAEAVLPQLEALLHGPAQARRPDQPALGRLAGGWLPGREARVATARNACASIDKVACRYQARYLRTWLD